MSERQLHPVEALELSERLTTPEEITAWVAERKAVLTELVAAQQQLDHGSEAA